MFTRLLLTVYWYCEDYLNRFLRFLGNRTLPFGRVLHDGKVYSKMSGGKISPNENSKHLDSVVLVLAENEDGCQRDVTKVLKSYIDFGTGTHLAVRWTSVIGPFESLIIYYKRTREPRTVGRYDFV